MIDIQTYNSKEEAGKQAGLRGAELIKQAILDHGHANMIMATGAAQFDMLNTLIRQAVDWPLVTCFHLDEYIDLPIGHKASFRKFLKERFADHVRPGKFYYIDGEADPQAECNRLNAAISSLDIHVAFIGIGENAHLAFNDPPADFNTEKPYIEVTLDEACRSQQVGEGWFNSLAEVPARAISMSVKQILKSKNILCIVPEERKAKAVQLTLEGEITPEVPASILRTHDRTTLYLDPQSASLLRSNE